MYACGERVRSGRFVIDITLYKYLVYFIILDSSVLLLAFAALTPTLISLPLLLVYISTLLAATILLATGGD